MQLRRGAEAYEKAEGEEGEEELRMHGPIVGAAVLPPAPGEGRGDPTALYVYSLARGRVIGVWAQPASSSAPELRGRRDAEEKAAGRFIATTHSPPALVILARPSLCQRPLAATRADLRAARAPPRVRAPRDEHARALAALTREPRVAVTFDTGRTCAQSGVQDVLVVDPADGVLSLRRVMAHLKQRTARGCRSRAWPSLRLGLGASGRGGAKLRVI
ncbi:hypothetical protein FB451DRAFT_1561392 [Mycena latifolia]|nr:hypothetical protein FB451DRAFT_1561392 [Mycena latifolia]